MLNSKAVAVIVITSICFWLSVVAISNQWPHAGDELLRRFITFAQLRHYPLWRESQVLDKETNTWHFRRSSCTSPVIYASEAHLYGLTVEHCISDSLNRRIIGISVGEKPAVMLKWNAGRDAVRIWRTDNKTSLRGKITTIAKSWRAGDFSFGFGFLHIDGKLREVFSRGIINTNDEGWTDGGNLVHDTPAWFGWSGGGLYVFNEQSGEFQIVGLDERFLAGLTSYGIVVGQFGFAHAVDENIMLVIKGDEANPVQSPAVALEDFRSRFGNWEELDEATQKRWLELYEENEMYTLEAFVGVIIRGELWRLGTEEAIRDAWLADRLKVRGSLREVNWSEFRFISVAQDSYGS